MKKLFLLCTFMLLPFGASLFAYTHDSGVISNFYVEPGGAIAIKLAGGFPKSKANNECPGFNGWAGIVNADPILKSAILAAKVSSAQVTVTLHSCAAGASKWLGIHNIYIN